jgi:hypothetical protein
MDSVDQTSEIMICKGMIKINRTSENDLLRRLGMIIKEEQCLKYMSAR